MFLGSKPVAATMDSCSSCVGFGCSHPMSIVTSKSVEACSLLSAEVSATDGFTVALELDASAAVGLAAINAGVGGGTHKDELAAAGELPVVAITGANCLAQSNFVYVQ